MRRIVMKLREWNDIPEFMQNEKVKEYYNILRRRRFSLKLKRIFDVVLALILLIVLSPVILIVSICIKLDSNGSVFYRQERVTQYGKIFRIFKFRTMVTDADKKGSLVTTENDIRITKVGKKIRKYRIDEIPQLINILIGEMSFVGTRPEVRRYVDAYTDEMKATLLLPAGITSKTSIRYKDEDKMLVNEENLDNIYLEKVLPEKMKLNLEELKNFNIIEDFYTILQTMLAVI